MRVVISMSKSIAVWGSPGSGKSTLAGTLAYLLAKQKKNVVLFDLSILTPQLSVWQPFSEVTYSASLNSLMQVDELSLELVSNKIIPVTDYLGVMGFVRGEMPINSQEYQRDDKFQQIVDFVKDMADYLIFDCSSNVLESIYALHAISISNQTLRVLSPDIKGIVWEQSNVPMLQDAKFRAAEQIRVAGCCKSYHNISLVENVVGTFQILLPYCEDIDLLNLNGKLFGTLHTKVYDQYKNLLLQGLKEVLSYAG